MSIVTVEYVNEGTSGSTRPSRWVSVIDTAEIGTDDPERIERLAIETAPSGYLFHCIKEGSN
ncbi:hypothetical protein NY96_13440 [Xanthomonas citri pv. fuscans]|uniref:hypothetical protein n=1 Tax=Xanthomonas TaxID=338 RepID=UPI00038211DA|nr:MULTISPECIES: hypothetical protein [Xanthomonas]KGT55144.1 hypothetical protein NY96_13440 [Xanthomonas citri pv. fuscans]